MKGGRDGLDLFTGNSCAYFGGRMLAEFVYARIYSWETAMHTWMVKGLLNL